MKNGLMPFRYVTLGSCFGALVPQAVRDIQRQPSTQKTGTSFVMTGFRAVPICSKATARQDSVERVYGIWCGLGFQGLGYFHGFPDHPPLGYL